MLEVTSFDGTKVWNKRSNTIFLRRWIVPNLVFSFAKKSIACLIDKH